MAFGTLGVVAALSLVPSHAFAADEPTPYPECSHQASESDETAAKAAFQAGNVSFSEADYPRAILYWEDAYRRDCTRNQMLLNLARAYELNGQKKNAINSLETYLAREPNASDKPQVTRRLEALKKQLDSEEAAAASKPPAGQTNPPPSNQPPPSNNPPPAAEGSGGHRSVVPLVVAGVGGVMIIGGGVVSLLAKGDVDEYASHCDNAEKHTGCPAEDVNPANAARSRQTIGGVVAIVGVPVLAGGLIWYFVQKPEGSDSASATAPKRALLPAVSPEFTGLTFQGSF